MQQLPRPLRVAVEQLAELPGLGPKSALRMAMVLLKWPREKVDHLARALSDLRRELHICSMCAGLADSDPCPICVDPARDQEMVCVVSDWDSLLVIENAGIFRGVYLVLGGLLSPLEGTEPQNLFLDKLTARLVGHEVREVVLALGTTMDAESTASFVTRFIHASHPGIRVSRLAQGIPLGAEVKYMDKETLRQSLNYRQDV